MSARFLTTWLSPAALLLGGLVAPAAAQTPAPYDLHKLEQAQKTYHKAEHCRRQGKTAQAGRYYEEVQHLLPGSIYDHMAANRLRRLHAQKAAEARLVQVEVRFITLPEALFERMGFAFTSQREPQAASPSRPAAPNGSGTSVPAAPELAFLNDSQVRKLMETVQGDPGCHFMAHPQLITPNGHRGEFATQLRQYFVTGVKTVPDGGHVAYIPQEQPFTTGVQVSVQPVVSADRRFVRLNVKANVTDLDTAAMRLCPVTTFITPVYEGGAEGQPVPFTQYIQQPKFVTLALDKTVSIPDGGTVLLSGWKKPREVRNEVPDECLPVLSKIPYINRLFKCVGYSQETEHVLVMVTPRIVVNKVQEVAQTHPKAADQPPPVVRAVYQEPEHFPCSAVPSADTSAAPVSAQVAKLLKEYQQACSQGRYSAATQLAVQALAIDPACFSTRATLTSAAVNLGR